MLMGSDINPFDSQETKPYKNDPRIAAMTDLVDAYQRNDIHSYEKVLQNNRDLLADPFIAENIDEVTRNMRTKAIITLVAPYTRFTLDFIAKQLKISLTEVQDIIGFLIVDKRLRGKINQQDGTVEIESSTDMDRVQAVRDWSTAIGSLWSSILNEGDGFKGDDGFMGQTSQPSFGAMQPPSLKSTNGQSGKGRAWRGGKPAKPSGGALSGAK